MNWFHIVLIAAGVLLAIGFVMALLSIMGSRSERRQDQMRRGEDSWPR